MALVRLDPYDQPTRATAGTVIYRNGPVQTAMRSRSYPTIPKHLTRNPNLNAITILSERWELLSNAQRIGWGNYAYASPLIDAWGNDRYIRGYAHYMRSNRPRYLYQLPIVDDPPTTPGFPDYTIPATNWYPPDGIIQLTWPTADEWAGEDGAYLIIWLSYPTPTAQQFPPERYYWVDWVPGNSSSPRGSAAESPAEAPTPPATRLWIRTAVSRADGRYTSQ